jgi:cell envelope opacity-associated protein A
MDKPDKKPLKGAKKAARFEPDPVITPRQKKVAKAVARTPRKAAKVNPPTARVRRQAALMTVKRGY